MPLELAEGSLVDVFAEAYRLSLPASTEQIRVVRSSDGGQSWSSPVTVAQFPFSVVSGSQGHPIRASGQDVSAFAEGKSVYISWEYNRRDNSQIGVTYSTDEGHTWIRSADPVAGSVSAFLPEIAADARGDVGLTWYQAAASIGDPTTLEFGELDPGSAQWKIRALIGPFSLDKAPPSAEGYFLGDYEGLTSNPCGFRFLDSIATGDGSRITTARVCPELARTRPGG